MPNICGKSVKEALANLREMGFRSSTSWRPPSPVARGRTTGSGGSLDVEGVVYWAYKEPNEIIGYHYADQHDHDYGSGTPWLAKRGRGAGTQVHTYPTDWFQLSDAPYYCSFVVIQTTDSSARTLANWWVGHQTEPPVTTVGGFVMSGAHRDDTLDG
jgi:hypothetical protein